MKTDFEKLSLQKIDITGHVLGKFSTFRIEQEYANRTATVLEVTYTFPVSASATVTGFTALVGEKVIKGRVREKEVATKEYQKAMLRGDSAYMMTGDESNIFRMNIGKIAVGETVRIQIDYIDSFEILDSRISILIPTLVPPRYESEVTGKLNYSEDETEYRGNVTVRFDSELKIDDIESKTHSIKLENNTVTARNIRLDRDFVLDVRLAEQAFSKGYYRELPNGNRVVYLSFFPDLEVEEQHVPKNYVFVVDISGSMEGFKLKQTKEAAVRCLKQLRQGDRFNIIPFESDYKFFSENPVEYNAENYERGKTFVRSLRSRGGTELLHPLKEAIQRFGSEKIIFLFTDGQVGNESEIAGYVRQHVGKNALFVFGIDSSVNKKGLQEIAEAGRGKAVFIARDGMIQETVVRQFARVSSSSLFDITLNRKTNSVLDKIEKSRALFNHEYYDVLIETDRITDDFELTCKTGDKTYTFVIPRHTLEHSDLPLDRIYASEQIRRAEKYIAARQGEDGKGYKERIVEIAVEYQIDSKYTAFIAVNERDEKLTDIPELQDIVLDTPAGWDMMKSGTRSRGYREIHACYSISSSPKKLGSSSASRRDRWKRIGQLFDDSYDEDFSKPAAPSPSGDAAPEADSSVDLAGLFETVKQCEQLIRQGGDYRALFDEIVDRLRPYLSAPSKEYKQLLKKIKKETPNVYALLKPYLKPKKWPW
ncbi:MAG: VWA domain-containing protein [Tannerella sp.]|jgi:Ca-activated chloride channel family protein|nr:VWA domain-containing protein [Tannerella sp.]